MGMCKECGVVFPTQEMKDGYCKSCRELDNVIHKIKEDEAIKSSDVKANIPFIAKIENICAIGLIILFFMPWVSIGGFLNFSGYQIPDAVKGFQSTAIALSGTEGNIDVGVYFLYLVYLIPIFSVLTIILDINKMNTKISAFIAGVTPLIGFAYILNNMGTVVFKGMAIAAWLTIVISIIMLLANFDIIKLPRRE